MSEKVSEMPRAVSPNQYAAATSRPAKSVAQTEAGAHSVALWRGERGKREKFAEMREGKKKAEPAGRAERFRC